ncbi:MAG: hypothetical protein U0U69_08935 [Acidimicrobiia bacterium]
MNDHRITRWKLRRYRRDGGPAGKTATQAEFNFGFRIGINPVNGHVGGRHALEQHQGVRSRWACPWTLVWPATHQASSTGLGNIAPDAAGNSVMRGHEQRAGPVTSPS